jgi:thiamine-phosphate pyrophosphorylase
MKQKKLKEVFVYLDSINELIKFNILKIKNVNIIYDNYDFSEKVFLDIKTFCKKHNLNLFIKDNYQAVIKFKLAGLVITHANKKILGYGNPLCNKKKIGIIGKVHNQNEFFLKKQQKCERIIFSPIFLTKKYSSNQILNINKFNLISKNWNIKIFALGGINIKNISRLKMSNISGFAIKSFVLDSNIKNSFKLIHYLK